MDRPCSWPASAERHRARHGFERQPDPWRAGDERLEWALCLHLLSFVAVFPHHAAAGVATKSAASATPVLKALIGMVNHGATPKCPTNLYGLGPPPLHGPLHVAMSRSHL